MTICATHEFCCAQTGNAQAVDGKTRSYRLAMWAVLSNLGHGKFMCLGAGVVVVVCILAGSAAMLPALPQSGDVVPFNAGYLEGVEFIDDSRQAVRQDAATESDQQAPPIFGMETEPVAGELAAKWRAVEADIDREQQVLARCRAQEARRRKRPAGYR